LRPTTLSALEEDDGGDDHDHDKAHDGQGESGDVAVTRTLGQADQGAGDIGHDAGEDDKGDPVSDTTLGDLLAKPHDECGPGGE
jgi:hypothetical protein